MKPQTSRARYRFVVKYYHDGTPWLYLEPQNAHLPNLKGGSMGFDLAPGTTRERALELAELFSSVVTDSTWTT